MIPNKIGRRKKTETNTNSTNTAPFCFTVFFLEWVAIYLRVNHLVNTGAKGPTASIPVPVTPIEMQGEADAPTSPT